MNKHTVAEDAGVVVNPGEGNYHTAHAKQVPRRANKGPTRALSANQRRGSNKVLSSSDVGVEKTPMRLSKPPKGLAVLVR